MMVLVRFQNEQFSKKNNIYTKCKCSTLKESGAKYEDKKYRNYDETTISS